MSTGETDGPDLTDLFGGLSDEDSSEEEASLDTEETTASPEGGGAAGGFLGQVEAAGVAKPPTATDGKLPSGEPPSSTAGDDGKDPTTTTARTELMWGLRASPGPADITRRRTGKGGANLLSWACVLLLLPSLCVIVLGEPRRVALSAAATATSDALPAGSPPAWSPCPAGQGGDDCATFLFPLDRTGAVAGTVGVFVRRFLPAAHRNNNKTLWMISGGPGDSGNDFSAGAAHWAAALNITVYTFDQRGVGLSSAVNCATPPGFGFDPYNATFLAAVDACNRAIVAAHGAERLALFSTHDAAADLVEIVGAVAPAPTHHVSIYALSYGTYFANTYLQLPRARADALVLDGPVPPDRWPLENNGRWAGRVHGDLLRACAASSRVCGTQLGALAHAPSLTMDALVDGTLPCLTRLPWLQSHLVAGWAAYTTADVGAHVLAGPLWRRLLRCSASDAQQLTHFAAFRQQADAAANNSSRLKEAYTYGLSLVRGASELYSFASPDNPLGGGGPPPPLSFAHQVLRSRRLLADAGPELAVSFARSVSQWPLYTPNPATHRRYATLPEGLPALLMVGTLDPQTPHGLGAWFQRGLGGPTAIRRLTVPWAAHGTVNPLYPCSFGIATAFFKDPGTPVDAGCLARVLAPDFDGAENATQALSRQAFGTPDLWNGAGDEEEVDVFIA